MIHQARFIYVKSLINFTLEDASLVNQCKIMTVNQKTGMIYFLFPVYVPTYLATLSFFLIIVGNHRVWNVFLTNAQVREAPGLHFIEEGEAQKPHKEPEFP